MIGETARQSPGARAGGSAWDYFYPTSAVTLWGFTYVAGKFVVAELSPLLTTTLRFSVSALFVSLLLLHQERRFETRFSLAIFGLLTAVALTGNALPTFLYLTGLQYSSAVNASLVNAAIPALTVALAFAFLREPASPRQMVGVGLSLAGVVVVISQGSLDLLLRLRFNLGDLLFLGTMVSWAFNSILVKVALGRYTPLATATYSTIIGALLLILVSWPELSLEALKPLSPPGWAGLLYLAIPGAGIPLVLWNEGIDRLGVNRSAIFSNLTPLLGVVSAALILGEMVTLSHLLGALLVIGGVYLTAVARPR